MQQQQHKPLLFLLLLLVSTHVTRANPIKIPRNIVTDRFAAASKTAAAAIGRPTPWKQPSQLGAFRFGGNKAPPAAAAAAAAAAGAATPQPSSVPPTAAAASTVSIAAASTAAAAAAPAQSDQLSLQSLTDAVSLLNIGSIPGSSKSKCPPDWGRAATASGSSSPTSTSRVLICLITTGVHTTAEHLKHIRWTGCTKEDPLDPAGCTLPWSSSPTAAGYKPRGTWIASLIAGSSSSSSSSGVIPGSTDIHVVPIDGPGSGSLDPTSTSLSGKSRLRAYSVCEGRLRGLQAADYGSDTTQQPWRMVMLVDVAAAKPASSGTGEYAISEDEWVRVATGTGTPEAPHLPDILMIAPTGQQQSVTYPAALPGVLGVGGYRCSGAPLHAYFDKLGSKPDLLAPGKNVGIPGSEGGTTVWTDTSAAAALAVGAAARLWMAFPRCSARDVSDALRSTAFGGLTARLSLEAAEAALQQSNCGSQNAAS